MDIDLSDNFWDERYQTNNIGWDIGFASPAIINYFKDKPKDSRILIPGCGNSYEGEELHKIGFDNVELLDFSPTSKTNYLERVPSFDASCFNVGDFFAYEPTEKYDFIIEQTFFCALNPSLRKDYTVKIHSLLVEKGHLVGLMFDAPKFSERPPFGGCKEDYQKLFEETFSSVKIEPCKESIKPRSGTEVFIEIQK